MAIVANTYLTFDAKGIREDLSNVIYNISPEDTPFMSNIGRDKAENSFFEWQTDSLAAADTANAQLEGDDVASFASVAATTRLGNYSQISRKTLILSGTLEAVDKAGRRSELAYQLAKRSSEIKRDIESIMLANQGAVAGNSTTARKTGSLLAFIKTNTSVGATGVDPVYTNIPTGVRTDGTQRAFTVALLKTVLAACWTAGGNPKVIMLGSFNKQTASGFAGVATSTFYQSAVKVTSIIGAADVYVSDFGTLSIVPNRFQRARDALIVDAEYAALCYLRPFKTVELAKTGDAEKRMLIAEWGLKVKNEAAHGIVADLTTA